MIKSLFHVMLSLVLTTSILVPSILTLMDMETEAMAIMDFNEDEPQKKGESDKEEKDIVLQIAQIRLAVQHLEQVNLNNAYKQAGCCYISDIVLPPPEHTV